MDKEKKKSIGVYIGLVICFILFSIFVFSKKDSNNTENTINKKINTFGIKNIANINIEQNIFERIISTCKVKIDTDSRSTADETDIEIVHIIKFQV